MAAGSAGRSTDTSYPVIDDNQVSSRLRSSSASLPLGAEHNLHYRPALQSPAAPTVSRLDSHNSQLESPSIFTTSYSPAPLAAPLDYSRSLRGQDIGSSHMSPPLSARSEFAGAFQPDQGRFGSRVPARTFSSSQLGYSNSERHDVLHGNITHPLQRKRSFTIPNVASGVIGSSFSPGYGSSS